MKSVTLTLAFFGILAIPVAAQVDYESQIQPIFNANCTSCHGASGGVNLSSFEALMGSTGDNYGSNLVVSGDPDASGLVDKIEANPQFGSRMPQGGQLSDEEITLIRTWISEGANSVATSNEREFTDPESFRLIGNYPNPFNPSTQIRFSVPQVSQYTIAIYTITGSLLMEQVGTTSAGEARVSVNLGANPSGMYIYKVTAISNGFTHLVGTGTMTLIK